MPLRKDITAPSSTRPTQEAQVIPPIGIRTLSVACGRIFFVSSHDVSFLIPIIALRLR